MLVKVAPNRARFWHFFQLMPAFCLWLVESFAIGKACSTYMVVSDAPSVMTLTMDIFALVLIFTRHIFWIFVASS